VKQAQEIKTFLYSQYFADGLRIAFGALIPALLFSFFGNFSTGIVVSLGAVITSSVDTPGPTKDRRNAMAILVGLLFIVTYLTKIGNNHDVLMAITIAVLCFAMCMIAVYGARASSLGMAAMLVMVLNIDTLKAVKDQPLEHALYTMLGGAWYMLLSLTLTQFRPFRLAQQALAETIQHTAVYVQLRANFYDPKVDSDKNFKKLIDQQAIIHQHQDTVRELLFKSKSVVKDTTRLGRLLVIIFTDMVDIFEKTMATHYDYASIRQQYAHSRALRAIRLTINRLAGELENLAYYINANSRPKKRYDFEPNLEMIKLAIDQIEHAGQSALVLKRILVNIKDLVNSVSAIYQYFDQQENVSLQKRRDETDLSKFLSYQSFDLKILKDNMSLDSGTFRHALRMVIVMLVAFAISKTVSFGSHGYWVMMTALVILKPGFSLTKQRNYQRMTGTVIGGLAGAILLMTVDDELVRFVFLMIFMVLAYSFIRINYIVGVIFLTPYLLLLFSFLGMETVAVLKERVADTVIGSLLAFSSSYVIFPSWESENLQESMRKLLIANYNYLATLLRYMQGEQISTTDYKLVRKDVYVNMANMTSTFQRMITEPKSKQKNASDVNQFLIYNHVLSSYSFALVTSILNANKRSLNLEHIRLVKKCLAQLEHTIKQFKANRPDTAPFIAIETKENLNDENMAETEEGRLIKEQLSFMHKITQDLNKICENMALLEKPDPKIYA